MSVVLVVSGLFVYYGLVCLPTLLVALVAELV